MRSELPSTSFVMRLVIWFGLLLTGCVVGFRQLPDSCSHHTAGGRDVVPAAQSDPGQAPLLLTPPQRAAATPQSVDTSLQIADATRYIKIHQITKSCLCGSRATCRVSSVDHGRAVGGERTVRIGAGLYRWLTLVNRW